MYLIYILITKQILNNNVFTFTGGSIGALNGLYKYRRELALREAEGILQISCAFDYMVDI